MKIMFLKCRKKYNIKTPEFVNADKYGGKDSAKTQKNYTSTKLYST